MKRFRRKSDIRNCPEKFLRKEYDHAVEGWKNEIFQVCATEPLTLRQTVELMFKVNDWPCGIADWGHRPKPEREIRRLIRLYTPLPGWRPQISIEEGLHLPI